MSEKNWHDGVFFGLHFDIHAGEHDVGLGRELTTEHLVEEFEKIRPDWVQCDCKGHPGYTSYPTKVGYASPGIEKDALRMWRDATKQIGVPLVMHYSGVEDNAAVKFHPEWARVNAPVRKIAPDGTVTLEPAPADLKGTCNLSEYTEKLMIPQLLEIIREYDVDGFWVDGENWASAPCYCDRCRAEFSKRTGSDEPPLAAGEPLWDEWLQMHRDSFESHVERYRSAVKAVAPNVTICSNWMYTCRQPDDMKVPVDYISGDYDHIWSAVRAISEARLMSSRGIGWDLMAWGFSTATSMGNWQFKTAEALCSEVAVVLSCGGAVSIYETPNRTGRLVSWHMDVIAEVAKFCRARQKYCTGTESIPQIAIMDAPLAMYSTNKPLFNLGTSSLALDGSIHAFLDNGYHADVLTENDMVRYAKKYPICVIPEQERLAPGTAEALLAYVREGGCLIVSGPEGTKPFDEAAGVTASGADGSDAYVDCSAKDMYIPEGRGTLTCQGTWRLVKNISGEQIQPLLNSRDRGTYESPSGSPAAVVKQYGKGRIVCIYGALFYGYGRSHYLGVVTFMNEIIDSLGIRTLARAKMPAGLHMTLRRRDDTIFVNIINLRSEKPLAAKSPFTDKVQSAGPISVELELAAPPKSVYLAPTCDPVEWTHANGRLTVRLKEAGINDIIVIETV